jgi:hypothetical protein
MPILHTACKFVSVFRVHRMLNHCILCNCLFVFYVCILKSPRIRDIDVLVCRVHRFPFHRTVDNNIFVCHAHTRPFQKVPFQKVVPNKKFHAFENFYALGSATTRILVKSMHSPWLYALLAGGSFMKRVLDPNTV